MEESIIEHYKTKLGKYPSSPSGLDDFFAWHEKARDLWVNYAKINQVGVPKKAFIIGSSKVLFLPIIGSFPPEFAQICFDCGRTYDIENVLDDGLSLKAKTPTNLSAFFRFSDVVLIYFDFNFDHWQ
jgi:hypothetical protein